MPATKPDRRLFWLDMEMTGLDENTCKVLEVAAVVTDLDFKPLDEYQAVVHQPDSVLDAMDDWCKKTHGESGLTDEVRKGKPLQEVEQETIAFVKKNFGSIRPVMCGNSIHQDRRFIDVHMPELSKILHYRIIDVTSFKEILQDKFGLTFEKKERHRAKDDIHESIAELAHYVNAISIQKS